MARDLCIEFAGAFYHVFSRGLNRQWLFLDHQDFSQFLQILYKAKHKFQLRVFAYCLMNNHYHLYLSTKVANLSSAIKFLNQMYANYFLKKYPEKDGHVFRGRFKRKIVQDDLYSLILVKYIHQNPIKAQIVTNLQDWQWSSFNTYVNENDVNDSGLIEKEFILTQLGNHSNRISNFIEFHAVEEDELLDSKTKMFFGDKSFIKEIISSSGCNIGKLDSEVVNLSRLKGLLFDEKKFLSEIRRMNIPAKLQEKIQIYTLHEFSRISLSEIGRQLNKPLKTISKAKERFKAEIKEGRYDDIVELIEKCRMSRYDPS